MKRKLISLLLAALFLLTISPLSAQAYPKPERVQGTDIELVKKVTLKGSQGKSGRGPSYAATGTLGTECTGKKYAIIIGINDYPSSDLSYAVNDANEIYSLLTDKYRFPANNVKKILDTDATYDTIKATVNEVKALAKPGDEVVFFFSGHGSKGKVADFDSNLNDQAIMVWDSGDWGYIWDGELVQWFQGFKTSRIIFIFDSCLSGGMSVLKASGRIVNMACSANGYSYEGDWGGGHGQFTYYFVEEGMADGLADVRPDDERETVEEAFDYAKANCRYQSPVITDAFADDLLP